MGFISDLNLLERTTIIIIIIIRMHRWHRNIHFYNMLIDFAIYHVLLAKNLVLSETERLRKMDKSDMQAHIAIATRRKFKVGFNFA